MFITRVLNSTNIGCLASIKWWHFEPSNKFYNMNSSERINPFHSLLILILVGMHICYMYMYIMILWPTLLSSFSSLFLHIKISTCIYLSTLLDGGTSKSFDFRPRRWGYQFFIQCQHLFHQEFSNWLSFSSWRTLNGALVVCNHNVKNKGLCTQGDFLICFEFMLS